MKRFHRKWLGPALAVAILLSWLVSASGAQPASAQMGPPPNGIVCTESASPNPTFVLNTRTGNIGTPDGNVVFMWGLSEGGNAFQHPSPTLCVNQGDTVTIVVNNTLPQDISLVFPGQVEVLANGQPSQPQFDGLGALTSLAPTAAANGGSITYSFVADRPGTFLYESGTNPGIQVRMGLFGAIVVRPVIPADANNGRYFAYNDYGASVTTEFNHSPSGEILILQSEIDPYLNRAIQRGRSFNLNNFKPRYWMINGRGFPDTVAPNFATWLPSQPYGALAHVQPNDASNPLWFMERYINVTTQSLPFHPHGKNAVVIGRDGNPMRGAGGEDLSFERFSLVAAPGQTYDALFHYHQAEGYDSQSNPVPVVDPGWQNLQYGMYYSGSPYLGETGAMPPGMTSLSQCGEYYIIAHNHALFQLTSWGVPMTGPGTFMRVDPPGGCPPMP